MYSPELCHQPKLALRSAGIGSDTVLLMEVYLPVVHPRIPARPEPWAAVGIVEVNRESKTMSPEVRSSYDRILCFTHQLPLMLPRVEHFIQLIEML